MDKRIRHMIQWEIDEVADACLLSDQQKRILELLSRKKSLVQVAGEVGMDPSVVSDNITEIRQRMSRMKQD